MENQIPPLGPERERLGLVRRERARARDAPARTNVGAAHPCDDGQRRGGPRASAVLRK